MPKKFFDIVPLEKAKPSRIILKSKKGILSIEEEDSGLKSGRKSDSKALKQKISEAKKKSPFPIKKFYFIFGTLALAAASYIFFMAPSPKIEIKAKIVDIELSASVYGIVSGDANIQNENEVHIKTLSDEREVSGTFSSTGEALKEEKARGTIAVYNGASTEPRQLVPSRFVSADGKIFKSLKTIIIPGTKQEKGKTVPGQISVEVEAAEAGEGYNIGPTTFALPALSGSPLYTTIYAKSFSPMSGGIKTKIGQIKREDIEGAKLSLLQTLKKNSFDFFNSNLSGDFVLLDSAMTADIIKEESLAKVGDKIPSFSYKIKGKCIGFAFKKLDVESFSADFLTRNISDKEKVKKETFQVFPAVESINKAAGKIYFSLKIKARAYFDVDLSELKGFLAGKTKSDSEAILGSNPEIGNFKISNWFFWNSKLSKDPSQIDIKLTVE
jgi:hypothetical protein